MYLVLNNNCPVYLLEVVYVCKYVSSTSIKDFDSDCPSLKVEYYIKSFFTGIRIYFDLEFGSDF